jgi:hypothetical protein
MDFWRNSNYFNNRTEPHRFSHREPFDFLLVPSLAESLLVSMAILAPLAALVGGSRGSLVAPNADTGFDISLVVPAQERFLILRVRLVAFHAARRFALCPTTETTQMRRLLQNARTIPPEFLPRLLISGAHHS